MSPGGLRIDLVLRPLHSGWRYFPARDTGVTSFHGVAIRSTDIEGDQAALDSRALGSRERLGRRGRLYPHRQIHHTIALFPTDRAGIQHINHQVESADDILRSYHFLRERQVDIVFGPGRHPSSSAKFLYFQGLDGMVFKDLLGRALDRRRAALSRAPVSVRAQRLLSVGRQAQNRRVPHLRNDRAIARRQPHSKVTANRGSK